MTEIGSNDNDETGGPSAVRVPDAHGQAALYLIESLIHVLIERSVIGAVDAVDALDTAVDVKEDIGLHLDDTPETLAKSLALLAAIKVSIQRDMPEREDQAYPNVLPLERP